MQILTESRLTRALAILAIIEALIILVLLLTDAHLVVTASPRTVVDSPIALAARYDAPDMKFEEVVTNNLPWLEYRPLGEASYAVLAECAYQKKTNYVRILIRNGANVRAAIRELSSATPEASSATALIQKVQAEISAISQ